MLESYKRRLKRGEIVGFLMFVAGLVAYEAQDLLGEYWFEIGSFLIVIGLVVAGISYYRRDEKPLG